MADASIAPQAQMTSPAPPPSPGAEELKNTPDPKVEEPKAEKWPFAEPQPVREDQVRNAVNFLKHPKVQGTPIVHRRSFLERKGLTQEEIDEAFRRCPDPPSSETVKALVSNPGKDASPAPVQGQAGGVYQAVAQPQPQPLQHYTSIPSSAVVPARSGPHWSQLIVGAGLIAAAGAGAGYLVQKVLASKFRAWLRELLKEGKELPDSGNEAQGKIRKLSPLEEAVGAAAAAANAAAAAAAEMASTTREVLKSQSNEWQQLKNSIKSLENESEELKNTLLTMNQNLQSCQADEPGIYKGSVKSLQRTTVPVEQVQPRQGYQNLKVGNRLDKAQTNGHSTSFSSYVEEEQPWWQYKKSEVETFASTKQPADSTAPVDAELNQEIGSARPRTLNGEAQSRGGPLGRQGWVPPPAPRTIMPGAASAIRYQKPATVVVDEGKPTVVSEEKVVDSEASFEQVSSSMPSDKRSAYPEEKELDLQSSYGPPKMPEVSEVVEVTSIDKEIPASAVISEASEVNENEL